MSKRADKATKGSSAPMPGCCGAQLSGSKPPRYCTNPPVKYGRRCRMHGGASRIKSGKYSQRFRRESSDITEAIDRALQDPDLLDPRRSVALMDAMLSESQLIPTDEMLDEMVRASLPAHVRQARAQRHQEEGGLDDYPISDAERELARQRYMGNSMEAVERFGKRQTEAIRAQRSAETIIGVMGPLFAELGLELEAMARRFIADDAKREQFMSEFRVGVTKLFIAVQKADD